MENKIPEWTRKPIDNYLSKNLELTTIIELSKIAFTSLEKVKNLVEISYSDLARDESLAKVLKTSDLELQMNYALALLEDEVSFNFPRLNSNAIVLLWSSLEHFVYDFVKTWLQNNPQAMQVDAIKNIKISVGEYNSLDEIERYTYIIELLEKQEKIKNYKGVNRFDELFKVFGLSSPLDERTKKNIFELQQVRNVIVHQNGIVDKKLVSECPWIEFKIGDELILNHDYFIRYYGSVNDYILQIYKRIHNYFGVPIEEKENIQDLFIQERRKTK